MSCWLFAFPLLTPSHFSLQTQLAGLHVLCLALRVHNSALSSSGSMLCRQIYAVLRHIVIHFYISDTTDVHKKLVRHFYYYPECKTSEILDCRYSSPKYRTILENRRLIVLVLISLTQRHCFGVTFKNWTMQGNTRMLLMSSYLLPAVKCQFC